MLFNECRELNGINSVGGGKMANRKLARMELFRADGVGWRSAVSRRKHTFLSRLFQAMLSP